MTVTPFEISHRRRNVDIITDRIDAVLPLAVDEEVSGASAVSVPREI